VEHLSERERAIVALLAEGQTAKLIARELQLAPRTVEMHLDTCRQKLGATNNAHLVATALRGR
jgi:DNA-binding CsgD family transcriptional regulator